MLSLKFKQLFLWKSNMRCTLCTAMPQPPRLRAVSSFSLQSYSQEKTKHASRDKQRSCQGNLMNQLLVTRLT